MTVPGDTIELITARLSGGETTAHAVASRALDNAESLNQTLNAFLQLDREGALRRAAELDAEGAAAASPLRGVPVAIKDNICVRGM
jgi:aspartyl-tRNA(Asn)/glutamyl-tRNA(Gln) amidotransferase subunit A